MTTKTIPVYSDVPNELLDLMNMIKYEKFTPEAGEKKLNDLIAYVDATKVLPLRAGTGYPMKNFVFRSTVPDKAIRLLSRYDFTKLNALTIGIAKAAAKKYLQKNGLL